MAVFAGPKDWWFNDIDNGRTYVATKRIIQNGLVLNLDAGVSSSYLGSGTTWTDISGNGNSGNLTNGPTYDSGNGGTLVYDGTNDYVDVPFQPIQNSSSFTINGVVKFTTVNEAQLRPIIDSGHFATVGLGYGLVKNRSNGLYFQVNIARLEVQPFLSDDTWYDITCTASNTSPYTLKIYVNGVEQTSTSTVNSSAFTSNQNNIRCFGPATGFDNYTSGKQAALRVYNRALSAAEVQQNFNAIRGRFGI